MILATGSGYRKLGLPREDELSGRGVSWCATCDGFFFRDQHIAVVGGGDTAIEEATFLTRFGSKVSLIVRRDELRASKIMQERAFADPKIEFIWNSAVDEIHGADRLESLTLRDTVTGETSDLPVTGLFIAIGHDPRSELFPGQVDLDDDGYVLVEPPVDPHQPARRVRRRRRGRPQLPPGDHRRRHRLRRRPGRRALPRRARPRGVAATPRPGRRRAGQRDRADRRRLTPRASGTSAPAWCSISTDLSVTEEGTARGQHHAVTDAEFEAQVLKSDKPVLVDFWAEWCGPCRQVAPILDEIATEHGDKITFVKMNVDENPVTPSSYRVTGIPTINVYQGGEVVKTIVGARPKADAAQRAGRLHRLTRPRLESPSAAGGSTAFASQPGLSSDAGPRRRALRRGLGLPGAPRRPAARSPPRPRPSSAPWCAGPSASAGVVGCGRWVLNPTLPRKSAGTTAAARRGPAGRRTPRPPRTRRGRSGRAPCPAPASGPARRRAYAGSTYAVVRSTASGETGAVGKPAAPGTNASGA